MSHRKPRSGYRLSILAAVCFSAGLSPGAMRVTMAQDAAAPSPSARLLALAESTANLAALQLEETRELLRNATTRYESGTDTLSGLLGAQLAFHEADSRLKVARLDIDAIETGGTPVRMEISAPLIGGRDFVSERLQIESDLVARRTTLVNQAIGFAETRVQAGVAREESLAPLNAESWKLALETLRIRADLEQRQAFLAGGGAVAAELAR